MTLAPDKYAHVKLDGIDLKPSEPWFLLRGQDILTPNAIRAYANLVEGLGGEAHRLHADDLREHATAIAEWQIANSQYVKEPD